MDLLQIIYGLVSLFVLCYGHARHDGRDHDLSHSDKQHVKEHLEEISAINFENSTQEEIDFYYFSIHDADKNKALDGLEIYRIIQHEEERVKSDKPMTQQELMKMADEMEDHIGGEIDAVLKIADISKDGYISYPEFQLYRKNLRKLHEKHRAEKL